MALDKVTPPLKAFDRKQSGSFAQLTALKSLSLIPKEARSDDYLYLSLSLYIYIYLCIYIYMCIYIFIYIYLLYTHIYIYTYIYICISLYIYIYSSIHIYIYRKREIYNVSCVYCVFIVVAYILVYLLISCEYYLCLYIFLSMQ